MADTRVTRKTDHPLDQSMARELKVLHVDGKDVALGLNLLVRTVVHQVYSESSSYRFYVRLAELIVNRVVNFVQSYKELGMKGWELRCPRRPCALEG